MLALRRSTHGPSSASSAPATRISARHGRLDPAARRRRLPRAPVLDGRRRPARSSCPRASSASRSSTRAASSRSGGALARCTGTSCSRRDALPGDRNRRLAPSRLRLRSRVDVDAGREPYSRRGARGAREGAFYSSAGPALHGVSCDGDAVEVRCSPCRSVTLVCGRTRGAAAHAGRLRYCHRAASARAADDGLSLDARLTLPPGARHVRRRGHRRRGREGVDEPASGGERGEAGRWRSWPDAASTCSSSAAGSSAPAIAAQAAHAGLAVALVDAGRLRRCDLERSSKLIHGGLRYLRLGDVRLVREAHHERRALLEGRRASPRPPAPVPAAALPRWPVSAAPSSRGSRLYSTLAGDRLNWLVEPARARRMVPELRLDGLRCCGALRGRVDERRAALPGERPRGGGRGRDGAQLRRGRRAAHDRRPRSPAPRCARRRDGAPSEARARSSTRPGRGSTTFAGSRIRGARHVGPALSKGVHVLVPRADGLDGRAHDPAGRRARQLRRSRGTGCSCSGRRTTPYDGRPRRRRADRRGRRAGRSPRRRSPCGRRCSAASSVRATFAGLRVLPAATGDTSSARRETVFDRRPGGHAERRRAAS